jgi:serine/threonine protein kinase
VSAEAKQLINDLLVIDPTKRLTGKQVLEHPFIKMAGDKALTGAQQQLRKYIKTQKLRKAAMGIIAARRIEKALEGLRNLKVDD